MTEGLLITEKTRTIYIIRPVLAALSVEAERRTLNITKSAPGFVVLLNRCLGIVGNAGKNRKGQFAAAPMAHTGRTRAREKEQIRRTNKRRTNKHRQRSERSICQPGATRGRKVVFGGAVFEYPPVTPILSHDTVLTSACDRTFFYHEKAFRRQQGKRLVMGDVSRLTEPVSHFRVSDII